MADELVLEILKGLQSGMARLQAAVTNMQDDLSRVKGTISKLEIGQNILTQDVRMIRAGLADLGLTRVSAGEIEAIHSDINGLVDRMNALEARLGPV